MVTPAVDFALTVPEADPARLVLAGTSPGGYLAARATACEHRIAACVLHDEVWDLHETIEPLARRAASRPGALEELLARSTSARWMVRNGLWTLGVSGFDEVVQATRAYTMAGIAGLITCPTLVLDAENDQFFSRQPGTCSRS